MIELDIQNPAIFDTIPCRGDMQSWVNATIQPPENRKSMVIRFVDEDEGIDLNSSFRQKDSATNVLSFPYQMDEHEKNIPELAQQQDHLGDLVLCEPVVRQEALLQKKKLQQHWAHLIVHGTLHLQGYDHLNDEEATEMETLEIKILKGLGFNNPYQESQ